MADPFDLATTRQRTVVLVALLAFFVLFAVELVTGDPRAAALSDLVIAGLAIPSSVVVLRRATAGSANDWVALAAALAFLLAGLAIGYSGLAALTELESVVVVDAVGSAALLLALVLYLYRSWE